MPSCPCNNCFVSQSLDFSFHWLIFCKIVLYFRKLWIFKILFILIIFIVFPFHLHLYLHLLPKRPALQFSDILWHLYDFTSWCWSNGRISFLHHSAGFIMLHSYCENVDYSWWGFGSTHSVTSPLKADFGRRCSADIMNQSDLLFPARSLVNGNCKGLEQLLQSVNKPAINPEWWSPDISVCLRSSVLILREDAAKQCSLTDWRNLKVFPLLTRSCLSTPEEKILQLKDRRW